jgi:hypothetical protein
MLPEAARFTDWQGKKLGVIQKEYRTPTNLGRSKRQNWDIAVVKNPPSSDVHGAGSYDYLRLLAVVEFGLNEAIDHLEDDLQRLTHREANVENRFAVHLHRLSSPGGRTSGRDWSPRSRRIVSLADVVRLSGLYDVEVYYAMADSTGRRESGAWRIASGQEARIGG